MEAKAKIVFDVWHFSLRSFSLPLAINKTLAVIGEGTGKLENRDK